MAPEKWVSQDRPRYLLTVDDATVRMLADLDGSILNFDLIIKQHLQHMMKTDCSCPWGKDKATALYVRSADVVLLITDDPDGVGEHHYYMCTTEASEGMRATYQEKSVSP